MINSLSAKNFRSYKDIFIEFDRRINIFIGTSDSGKTNILRAIELVTSNKPSGNDFRSYWGGDTEVKLGAEAGGNNTTLSHLNLDITRLRTKTENIYKLGSQVFKSFGQDVPEEIKQLLNFSSLNLQSQFDSPFLLAMSGGEVARYLNKIVHLDKIDLSLSNIGKTLRKEQTDLKYAEGSLVEAEEKAKTFDWIDEAEGCLVKLEQFENVVMNKKTKTVLLQSLIGNIECYDRDIEKISQLTQHEGELDKLMSNKLKLEAKEKRYSQLNSQVDNLRQIENAITDIGGAVPKWQEDFDVLMPQICPLCGRGE